MKSAISRNKALSVRAPTSRQLVGSRYLLTSVCIYISLPPSFPVLHAFHFFALPISVPQGSNERALNTFQQVIGTYNDRHTAHRTRSVKKR